MSRIVAEHFAPGGKPKRAFETRTEAIEFGKGEYRAYQCTFCGKWHLASIKKKAVRKRQ